MPSLSFAQAKVLLAPYFTSQGPTDPAVGAAINFVNEKFISSGQWKGNRFIKNFSVSEDSQGNFYFDTEAGVESVMKVIAVDYTQNMPQGEIVEIMGDWYPFNDAGLGFLPPDYAGDTQIIRQGQTTTTYALVSGTGAIGDGFYSLVYSGGDPTQPLWQNPNGTTIELNSPGWRIKNGDLLEIASLSGDYPTTLPWECVWPTGVSVVKSTQLSDTQRYRVIGRVPENRTMYCIVKRGYVPLINNNDQLVPSNRNAYRYGIQAFNYENVNELERAQVYWQLAYQSLNEEAASFEEGSADQVDIQTKAFSPSLIQNLI
jgi:hypothetical protein